MYLVQMQVFLDNVWHDISGHSSD